MRKLFSIFLAICILAGSSFLFTSCDYSSIFWGEVDSTHVHTDADSDEICDICRDSVLVIVDFYVVNDLHGKFCDTSTQPGVDELSTYLKKMAEIDDNTVLLSSGDMWQGTAESNLSGGILLTEWMNEMGFVSMTLGNHEFDWGEDAIRENLEVAEFPFLAINIYDLETGELADYCTPSVMIERDGIQIGIIGAIGDCYSSIASDMVEGIEFKVGKELSLLVKREAGRLREAGADLIIYSLHDGYGNSGSGTSFIPSSNLSTYYDSTLSNGFVDISFESHTHQHYTLVDAYDVYHIQAGGENYGISHVEIAVNMVTGDKRVTNAGIVRNSVYGSLADDPVTEALEDKYFDVIDRAYSPLGTVSKNYDSSSLADLMAELYLDIALKKWGDTYDIVAGGGYIVPRSPYNLTSGVKTYADILSLFPFDNRLVLCSVSGEKLVSQFIESQNSSYHIAMSEYGENIIDSISPTGTYYVMVDTYTALYPSNGLTVIEYYDNTTFARDLLADYIKGEKKEDNYTLTSIPDILTIGNALSQNASSVEYYYVKGTIVDILHSTYGNCYIEDEDGNQLYIYGLYDESGVRYDSLDEKPDIGDEVILFGQITNYVNSDTQKIEIKNAVLIELNP